jgi:hypothetical protein
MPMLKSWKSQKSPKALKRKQTLQRQHFLPSCVSLLVLLVVAMAAMVGGDVRGEEGTKGAKIRFEKLQLDPVFRSEGVAVADINNDGKLDIVAGYVWYEAPDWKMHTILETAPEYDPRGYSNSFCTFAEDLNGNGWTDIIVVDFPGTPTWWFENPGTTGEPWKRHTLTPVTNNESPQYVDVNGDGELNLLAAYSPNPDEPDGPDRRMAYMKRKEDPYQPWEIVPISAPGAPGTQRYSHGLGLGDVNGNGRNDILCGDGWWEAPESAGETPWKFHPAPFGGLGAQIYAYDFIGNGVSDVLTSSPHAYGMWWHEQVGANEWKTHEIDSSISQLHAVCLADIDGDGLPDIVTGKRWWAHVQGDPGVDDPAVICWYQLVRENGRPQWIRHQFDHDSGVGTQFEVTDVDGDGLLDVVTSNKKGVHVFLQRRD